MARFASVGNRTRPEAPKPLAEFDLKESPHLIWAICEDAVHAQLEELGCTTACVDRVGTDLQTGIAQKRHPWLVQETVVAVDEGGIKPTGNLQTILAPSVKEGRQKDVRIGVAASKPLQLGMIEG